MDVIVLVKYVADIERVPPDAWDPDTGTLKRARLRMVANPLDDNALAVARRLAGKEGTIVAVSMGPGSAESVCRRAVAYGAAQAVLVSDRGFAGSDTLATAKTLGAAVIRAERVFRLHRPAVICGMQSPDGDTAQVPAEVAAQLGLPLIPYATDVDRVDGSLVCTVMERDHHSVVRVADTRAVVACTGFTPELPFHTTLDRFALAAQAEIAVWGPGDLALSAEEIGLSGSATKVVNIESVPRSRGAGTRIALGDSRDPAGELGPVLSAVSRLANTSSIVVDETPQTTAPTIRATRDDAGGCCLSLVELSAGEPTQATLELVGETRRLASCMGRESAALSIGSILSNAAVETLGSAGASRVIRVTGPNRSASVDHHQQAHLLAAAIDAIKPPFVLVPASLTGRTVSALTAGTLGLGLTADCTGLEVVREDDEQWRLYQTRPALGGNILATIVSKVKPEMATVRAGVFRATSRYHSAVPLEDLVIHDLPVSRVLLLRRTASPASDAGADTAAEVVVAVGSGIGSRERLERFVRPFVDVLKERLGPDRVTLACSRAAVEADILPYPYQIGQTGKTVRPALNFALGISGAIQHRLGMEHSVTVCSVNPDPGAPIHDISHFSIIATIEEAIPLLTKRLAEL